MREGGAVEISLLHLQQMTIKLIELNSKIVFTKYLSMFAQLFE